MWCDSRLSRPPTASSNARITNTGHGGAGVSTSTFYKHFGNLWDCALAAYVATSDRLCAAIEDALRPLGVKIDAMPVTPRRLRTLIADFNSPGGSPNSEQ